MTVTDLPVAVILELALSTMVVAAIVLAFAPQIAELLIRFRSRRLPAHLSERFSEEWIAEMHAIPNRVRKLTFAIAIAAMRSKTLVDAEDLGAQGLTGAAPVLLSVDDVRVYSDFGNRFIALLFDTVLASAASYACYLILGLAGIPASVMRALFVTTWLVGVQVCCVHRFGGTPGKLLLKLRIVSMNGEPLTYRQAFIRALPDYCFTVIGLMVTTWALAQIDPTALDSSSSAEQSRLLLAAIPVWVMWPLRVSQFAWAIGEIGVFVDSYERRALHDLLAGTVVVLKIPRVMGTLNLSPPTSSTSAYR